MERVAGPSGSQGVQGLGAPSKPLISARTKQYTLLGLGALAIAGGVVGILIGRNVIPLDLTQKAGIAVFSSGIAGTGIGVILIASKFICFRSPSKQMRPMDSKSDKEQKAISLDINGKRVIVRNFHLQDNDYRSEILTDSGKIHARYSYNGNTYSATSVTNVWTHPDFESYIRAALKGGTNNGDVFTTQHLSQDEFDNIVPNSPRRSYACDQFDVDGQGYELKTAICEHNEETLLVVMAKKKGQETEKTIQLAIKIVDDNFILENGSQITDLKLLTRLALRRIDWSEGSSKLQRAN